MSNLFNTIKPGNLFYFFISLSIENVGNNIPPFCLLYVSLGYFIECLPQNRLPDVGDDIKEVQATNDFQTTGSNMFYRHRVS